MGCSCFENGYEIGLKKGKNFNWPLLEEFIENLPNCPSNFLRFSRKLEEIGWVLHRKTKCCNCEQIINEMPGPRGPIGPPGDVGARGPIGPQGQKED